MTEDPEHHTTGRHKGNGLRRTAVPLVIIVLAMLMFFTIALVLRGVSPAITVAVATSVCGLAVELVRRTGGGGGNTPATGQVPSVPTSGESGVADERTVGSSTTNMRGE